MTAASLPVEANWVGHFSITDQLDALRHERKKLKSQGQEGPGQEDIMNRAAECKLLCENSAAVTVAIDARKDGHIELSITYLSDPSTYMAASARNYIVHGGTRHVEAVHI